MTRRPYGAPRSSDGRATAERGSTLAALLATLAVGSILMTVATTQWTFIIRREKEKELIFRGTAIARAIQEFQQKQGRAPTTLEEMTKTRPPSLRQALAEPMTARYDREGKLIEGTGEWTLISAAQPGPTPPGPTPPGPTPPGLRRRGGPAITAFVGVRSKSEELSIGTYRDSEAGIPYSEWRFQVLTADPANLQQHVGGFDAIYPPGFAGLRVPGGPPFAGAPTTGPRRPTQGGLAPR